MRLIVAKKCRNLTLRISGEWHTMDVSVPRDLWQFLSLGDTISDEPIDGAVRYDLREPLPPGATPRGAVYETTASKVPQWWRRFTLCKLGVKELFGHVPEALYLWRHANLWATVATEGEPVEITILEKQIIRTPGNRIVCAIVVGKGLERMRFQVPEDLWHMLQAGDVISTEPGPGVIEYQMWVAMHPVRPDLVVYFTKRLGVPFQERHFALCNSGVVQVFGYIPERLYLRRLT